MKNHTSSFQALSFNASVLKAKASKYAIYGVAIAATSVVVATALSAYLQHGHITIGALIDAQKTNAVLWFLDLTPFFFALWGQLVGSVMSYHAGALMADQIYELRTQTAAIKNQANYDSTHDSITGLPNRMLFNDRVIQAIQLCKRNKNRCGVILLDLDRFKDVNDTLGHYNGDRLLKLVGMRLEGILRKSDTLARLGGDEFAVLLADISDSSALKRVADKIQQVLKPPFVLEELSLDVQASAGAVVFPDHGDDVDTLLQRADVAMYVAKHGGKGTVVYEENLDQHSPYRLALMGELRQAIEGDDLLLHYQPKIYPHGDRVCSAEVLLRWNHKIHGLIRPDEFIGLAERTGLIKPLTRWVLKHAMQQGALWHSTGRKISLAVNLSARNLLDTDFPEILSGLLAASEFPQEYLVLEITETAIMADPDLAQDVLQRIAETGVSISIDDFGTGYSSLAYLKRLPVSELKIDRSFVQDMLTNSDDATIVSTTIEMAHHMGLEVVAEGVQDLETSIRLSELGCDYLQGYYFSKPLDARSLQSWLDKNSNWKTLRIEESPEPPGDLLTLKAS